jgi:hypothetical protein
MPKNIQFWTRTNGWSDTQVWTDYDGTRLDLLYPSFWWDNNPKVSNVIVLPDPYMLNQYVGQI